MRHANLLTDRQMSALRRRYTRTERVYAVLLAIPTVTLFVAWLLQVVGVWR